MFSFNINVILIVLLPLSFVILLVLVWFLLRASIREIQQERISILKLFLGIPKDNILGIVGQIRGRDGREGEHDNDEEELFAADEDEVSTFSATVELDGEAADSQQGGLWILKSSRLSMLRSFFFRFLFSLLLVFILVLVASAIVLASVQDFRTTVDEVNLAGKRRTYVSHLHSCTLALAYYAEISRTYPQFNSSTLKVTPNILRDFIASDLRNIHEVNYDLTYGVNGRGGISSHNDLVYMTFNNESCQALDGYAYTCSGMNSLIVYVDALANVILAMPDNIIYFNTTQIATLSDVTFMHLGGYLVRSVGYYRGAAYDVIEEVRIAVIVTFVLIFPVLLAVNFLLRPMSVQIKQEHQRTLRMLLMIPLNVIDNTPAIKDYLDALLRDSGRTPWYKGKSKRNNQKEERFLSTHEPLLQAVVREAEEALLVISAEGTVEMCNPASERLFGYEKRHMVGHHISTIFTDQSSEDLGVIMLQHRPRNILAPSASTTAPLLNSNSLGLNGNDSPSEVREQLELMGRRSDGGEVPVSVTLSRFKVNSKTYYGTYIRDITYTKNMEAQVEKERDMLNTQQKKLQECMIFYFCCFFVLSSHIL